MKWQELSFFQEKKHKAIAEKLQSLGRGILPNMDRWFYAYGMTPFDSVKVIILGQDPYPDYAYAMGLAFSIHKYEEKLPPSLQNIFKELKSDLNIDRNDGDLTDWAKQGVFLLNSSLTTSEGDRNAHKGVWDKLIKETLHALAIDLRPKVFIHWGLNAQKLIPSSIEIGTTAHKVIRSAHPSPLSADRGFFGSKPFSQTNTFLRVTGQEEIQWGQSLAS